MGSGSKQCASSTVGANIGLAGVTGCQPLHSLQDRWELAISSLLGSLAPANSSEQAWAQRFQSEIRFVSALLHAQIGNLSAEQIDPAVERLQERLVAPGSRGETQWAAAVEAAEAVLLPMVGPLAQSFVIHLVGHAHIDMNWMWDWPETVRVTRDTFRTMDQIMSENPDFRFSQSQASVYVAMQELYPEIYRRIVERQRRGQWEVTASTWVEPDANLPSGESWARQLLYTKRYFARTLGLSPEAVPVAWQPDTFGHPFTIPTILQHAGIPYLYYCRGGHLGPWWRLFWWEGPDGSRVLAFHDNDLWYNGPARPLDAALAAIEQAQQTGVTDYLFVYGVGDHGGGPTRRDLAVFHQAQQWPLFPRLVFSTAKQFFERVAATLAQPVSGEGQGDTPAMPGEGRLVGLPAPSLPVYRGELNTDLSGCYSSQARIKQQNRDCETALTRAETWRALSLSAAGLVDDADGRPSLSSGSDANPSLSPSSNPSSSSVPSSRSTLPPVKPGVATPPQSNDLGGDQPRSDQALLEQAWQKHAFNQFHDILPGSGVAATYQHALGIGQEIRATAEAVEDRALSKLLACGLAYSPTPLVDSVARLKPTAVAHRGAQGQLDPDWVRPVVVSNPLPWEQSNVLSLTIWDPPASAQEAVLIDPTGRVLLTQRLFRREEWGHQRLELLFPAVELPPLGLRSYAVLLLTPAEWQRLVDRQGWQRHRSWHDFDPAIDPAGQPGGPGVQGWIDGTGQAHLENAWLAATIEPGSGAVVHLIDKEKGTDLVPPGQRLGLLELNLEAPHGASAWKIGPFAARQLLACGATLRLEHRGPLQATAVVLHTHANSRFELRIGLSALARRLEYHLSADWAERSSNDQPIPTLQVAFPADLSVGSCDSDSQASELLYEIPFGVIRRSADGMEVPAQRFVTAGRLLVLNRGRYGFSAAPLDTTRSVVRLRMTLLRATHDPDPLPDQGRHEIEWSVMPNRADAGANIDEASYAAQQASEYQYPAQARSLATLPEPPTQPTTPQVDQPAQASSAPCSQPLGPELSWLVLQPAGSVAWSVLKAWEGVPNPDALDRATPTASSPDDFGNSVSVPPQPTANAADTDWVIRLYEVNGRPQKVQLRFGPALLALRGCPQVARELDLLERPIDAAILAARRARAVAATPGAPGQHPSSVDGLRLESDGVTIALQAYEIKTILLHWDAPRR